MTSFVSYAASRSGVIPEGETVCWSGAPKTGLMLRATDWLKVPFAVAFTGISLVIEYSAIAGGSLVGVVFGLPFLAAGLYALVGHLVWDAWVRGRTHYVVTDHAAYVLVEGRGGRYRRISGAQLCDVQVEHKADGSGTLRFGSDIARQAQWGAWPWMSPSSNGFEAVRDILGAYDAVLAAQRASGPS